MDKNNLPETRQRENLLFDFYGALLTERQKEIFTMHNMEDCSLAEISEILGITPQGVSDIVKRSKTQLNRYEVRLNLVARFDNQNAATTQIKSILDEIENCEPSEINDATSRIRNIIDTLLL